MSDGNDFLYDDDGDEHEQIYEYGEISVRPKHGPHRSGSPGGSCTLFPNETFYHEVNDLEVVGFFNFTHVRCPLASTTPCLCGRRSLHLDSLVVAVDGACPNNGKGTADKSAYGVFFGPNSPMNMAGRVIEGPVDFHTSQRAELTAAFLAIEASRQYIDHGGQWECDNCPEPCAVTHLVIKSDSAYLVNGITTHVNKWRVNGWRNAKGSEVKNKELWLALDQLVSSIISDTGAAIDFWHVPRHQNQDADELARQGLAADLPF